jgi:hypothetical protein
MTRAGTHWSEAFGPRGFGCVLLLFGALFCYWGIYSPLAAAARQEERVSLFETGAVIGPGIAFFGLIWIMFGQRASAVLGAPQQPSLMAGLGLVAWVMVGMLIAQLIKATVQSYGYSF